MNKYIFLVLSLTSVQAWAVGFHCYSARGAPVQTYEYGSGVCSVGEQISGPNEDVGKEGEKPVLCVVTALCKAVSDEEALNEAPFLNSMSVDQEFNARILKISQLICKGTAVYKNGLAMSANCPPVNECKDQVMFNYFAPQELFQYSETPINVTKPEGRGKIKREVEGDR